MRYWDASALVSLLVEQSNSDPLRALEKEDPFVVTWWGTPVECHSALCRLKRLGNLSEKEWRYVSDKLNFLISKIDVIAPSMDLRDRAIRLLALHPLKAGDALQLASALRWSQEKPAGVGFVCLDDRLRNAALVEGFQVLP